jgi:hypothetical protein
MGIGTRRTQPRVGRRHGAGRSRLARLVVLALGAGVVPALAVPPTPAQALSADLRIDTYVGYADGILDHDRVAIVSDDAVQDTSGTTYIADSVNHVVWSVEADGDTTRYAGTGIAQAGADTGPADATSLVSPTSVALDGDGNLFITETGAHRVRKVDAATGTMTTIAGTGAPGFSGEGGPATEGQLFSPYGVAVDSTGQVFIADTHNHRIRRVDGAGDIWTAAGTGTSGFSGDGGLGLLATLRLPEGVGFSDSGNLLIADTGNHRVRRVNAATGVITTIAGTGTGGFSGDGGPGTSAQLHTPRDVAGLAGGGTLVADDGNRRIRLIQGGAISTVAGNGSSGTVTDGGVATDAPVGSISGVGAGASAASFVLTSRSTLKAYEVDGGTISVVAGNGRPSLSGEAVPARQAQLDAPHGIANDGSGTIWFTEAENGVVRKVAPDGTITRVAGPGVVGVLGDGGPAVDAHLDDPVGVAVDGSGNVFISDVGEHRVRRVDAATGIITTIAGTGTAGFSGDGGPGTAAKLDYPTGLAVGPDGGLYIADRNNQRVRRVDLTSGTITTVAGNGSTGFAGDGGPATAAKLNSPTDVAFDPTGALHIADNANHRIRKVSDGKIDTVAGTGSPGFSGDQGQATLAKLQDPDGIGFGPDGQLVIADSGNFRIRAVEDNMISTLAGDGTLGFEGDGGDPDDAALGWPRDVVVSPIGDVLWTEATSNRVRSLTGLLDAAFTPLVPTRVLDSRKGTGGYDTPWGAHDTRELQVAGTSGVPVHAKAVLLNITGVSPTEATHLTVHPSGGARPLASNLNLPAGDVRAVLVLVRVGPNGNISIFNNSGDMDVVADVVGYYAHTGEGFGSLRPTRLLDSRDGTGGYSSPWGPGVARDVVVADVGGVPDDARAVVLNVTAVDPTAGSHLTVYPAGAPRPLASSLNFPAGDVRANLVVVPVGPDHKITIFNNSGEVDVLADVMGYYGDDADARGLLVPVTPTRLVDSRKGTGGFSTPWGPKVTREVQVSGVAGIPEHASSVVLSVTAVGPSARTHLTVWPAALPRPTSSNLNLDPGETVPNLVVTPVPPNGEISIFNNSGAVDVVVDIVGFNLMTAP